MRKTVCLLGNASEDPLSMHTLAAESGWSFEHAPNLGRLREIGALRDIVAVLIDAATLGLPLKEALQAVSDALPKTLPILCHKASETIRWAELEKEGAFHALLLPLCASEVRQSLGFVWEAQQRRRSRVVMLRNRPLASSHRARAARILA